MQTILAIESSTQTCSLALLSPNGVFERCIEQSQQHSALLLPAIADLLSQANCQQPDVIAVAVGPGAFTSLRVAVGTAQGLALGWGCPVVAVDTLAALAQQARRVLQLPVPCTVLAVLDARMGEAYVGAYAFESHQMQCVLTPFLSAYTALPPLLADCAVGNAQTVMPHWAQWGRAQLTAIPLAIDVLTLAQQGLATGSLQSIDAALLQPAYVRDQVAFTEAQRAAH